WKNRPAGLRTHVLVALASATFMIISAHLVPHQHYDNNPLLRADVTRIASGVVMGIGFLGAGAIRHHRGKPHGLTTAASLWLVAALGLAAGAGMLLLAGSVTVVALFVLSALRFIERRGAQEQRRRVVVTIGDGGVSRPEVLASVRGEGAEILSVDYLRDAP